MKLLFTITYYTPYTSGLTIHVQRTCEALAKRGFSITVLASRHEKHLSEKETVARVNVRRVSYLFRMSKGFFMPRYLGVAASLVKRSDVVVVSLPQFEGVFVALMARLLNKPIYCIYHCEVVLPKSYLNRLVEFFLHASHFLSLLCAKRVVTYTEDFANHSRLLRFFKRKLTYIYPPIPSPKVDTKLLSSLRRSVGKKRYLIGVAARIAAEKGIEYLLEAIPLLKKKLDRDFSIVLVGPKHPVGEEEYWVKVDSLVRKYTGTVQFLGTVPQKHMGSFYRLLDLLVLPSVNATEAFGMVQVEAMLCGVPVVATELPGVRVPISVTGMGELASVGDSYDLADKIAKVLLHKRRYVKRRRFIEEQFALKSTIEAYEKLFTSLS